MKSKLLILGFVSLLSFGSQAQAFSMVGSYSPTFESYTIGFGMATTDLLWDFQFGISDEFYSMGTDLQFGLTDDMLLYSSDLSVIYLGLGGEYFMMDDYELDDGYAFYGMASISYNQFIFSYGYGIYDYAQEPAGELSGFHKIKLTIVFADIVN